MAIGVANGVFFANYKKQPWFTQSSDYFERVTLDLGAVRSQQAVKGIYKFLDSEGLYTDTKLLWFGDAGIKTRETTVSNTPLTFVSKGYSLDPTPNDLTQTTELSQPYLSGNIAPNERYALKTPSNAVRSIGHPTITLAADYTLTFVLKYDKSSNTIAHITGADSGFNTGYGLNGFANENLFSFGAANTPISNIELFGKVKTLHIVRVGDIHNFYIDGILAGTYTSSIRFNFASLFYGGTTGRRCNNTNIHYYRIQSGAMTAPQVAAEHAMLRSIYPEIESVQIGTQTWATSNLEMVATPRGNVIPEVQLAAATEKITNIDDREFSSDTGFWTKGTGWSISGGTANCDGSQVAASDLARAALITTLRWHKVVFTVSGRTAGTITPVLGTALGAAISADGTYTRYIYANNTNVAFRADADFIGSIDDISIQELGWADRTELYNGLIAQGMSVADATKECAAWSYASNDPNLGAIMGKLYNKYAAKLLLNDITAYNVANPTAHWGWNVPTRAQLTTLSAQGGNASKVGGTDYWTTANGSNSNGLTLLGSGYRQADGTFADLKATTGLLCNDADFVRQVINADDSFDEAAITTEGYPIRLIKD